MIWNMFSQHHSKFLNCWFLIIEECEIFWRVISIGGLVVLYGCKCCYFLVVFPMEKQPRGISSMSYPAGQGATPLTFVELKTLRVNFTQYVMCIIHLLIFVQEKKCYKTLMMYFKAYTIWSQETRHDLKNQRNTFGMGLYTNTWTCTYFLVILIPTPNVDTLTK